LSQGNLLRQASGANRGQGILGPKPEAWGHGPAIIPGEARREPWLLAEINLEYIK